eukprot:GHVS01078208.1.p1 GENE.GHVS01078208.1~~GHVS01078208.1.p1  ORF type:complete len:632 (-),score=81.39 GHVS01078208.1:220-2115(-)
MAYLPDDYLWLVIAGALASFVTAFAIGANDVANTFSAAVGSRALPLWTAIILAGILETIGATVLGAAVTESIKENVIAFDQFEDQPALLAFGMLCALVGAGSWLLIASRLGMPVSTTHSIIGALLGFGMATGNPQAVQWRSVLKIVISWVVAPVSAAAMGMFVFTLIRATILRSSKPLRNGKIAVPVFMFLVSLSFSLFIVFKNPFSLGATTCTMINRDGTEVTASPCHLSGWAAAHKGAACGIGLGLAVPLAAALCCFVYLLASSRIASRRAQSHCNSGGLAQSYKLRSAQDETKGNIHDKEGMESNETLERSCEMVLVVDQPPCQAPSEQAMLSTVAEHGAEEPHPRTIPLDSRSDTVSSGLDAPLSSLGSLGPSEDGVAEEYAETMGWKARMRNRAQHKWNNMPWFKDLHADGCEEDDIVDGIQSQGEVFDENTEILFSCCQIISSSLGCLAHSANDTANAIGPFAAILTIYTKGLDERVHVDWYVLMCGGLSMAAGLAMMGYRVIQTMGVKMVKITPPRGFSVELGSAWVVLLFSYLGIPLSTTHCAVGSTLGVGLSEPKRESVPFREGMRQCPPVLPFINTAAVNWRLFGSVFVSWIGTVVFSCLVCMAVFAFSAYAPSVKCEVHK